MFPGFSGNYAILISPALGQRTAKRVKVLPAFSKAAGCRAELYGPKGVARGAGLACRLGRRWTVPTGHQRPCLPLLPKKGGRMSPSWGGTEPGPRPMRCAVSPAGSVGAERCPPGTSAPRRGVLRASGTRPGPTGAEAETPAKSLPQEAFSTLLRLPEAKKVVGRCPTPCHL